MISIGVSAYYWNRTVQQEEKAQFVGDDIPTIESVFDLKSGARARLVDRSGSWWCKPICLGSERPHEHD
jgi:hypothetical protein